jgi:hypothetical protein
MKRLIAVAALAAAVSTTPLWAQTEMPMGEALSMLETSVKRELNSIGLGDVDVMLLTLSQLAEIQGTISESSISETDKRRQIMAAVQR